MSNHKLLSRISVDPEICRGKPCIRGLRDPVQTILEYLAGGGTLEGWICPRRTAQRRLSSDLDLC
jgi:uncharacterized protein (DUF433 family)